MHETARPCDLQKLTCVFASRYHYLNNTEAPGALHATGKKFFETPDKLFHRTDDYAAKMLWDHGTLAHEPAACDRSYQHSDFPACGTRDLRSKVRTSESSPIDAPNLTAVRTWIKKDGVWYARFCDLKKESWFLSPYFSDNGLKSTPREIQRCSNFGVCPSIPFTVRAQAVPQRRVQIWKKDETEPEDRTRSYCTLDAARCGSFGQMVQSTDAGIDCKDAAESTKCRVDPLTSPLISIVFGGDLGGEGELNYKNDEINLAKLRKHCPYAFTETISDRNDITLFSVIRDRLTSEYDSQDISHKKEVHEMTNALVFAVFGLGRASNTRGLQGKTRHNAGGTDTPFDAYIKQGYCARYVAQRMKEQQSKYSEVPGLDYEISANDFTSPGTSLYLFADRVAIFVPMRWLMQCVVWAGIGDDGVAADFVKEVVDGNIVGVSGAGSCQNWIHSFDTKKMSETTTLKRRLLTSTSIFTVTENEDFVFGDRQIVRDMHTAVAWALDQIGARDRPDLWCLQDDILGTQTGQTLVDFATDKRSRSYFPGFAETKTVSDYDTFVSELDTRVPDMHSRVREFIFDTVNVEDIMKLTHADLFEKNLLVKRSDNLQDKVVGTDIRWSTFEFTALKRGTMETKISEKGIRVAPTWEEYLLGKERCTNGQKMLKSPEYLLRGDALRTCKDIQNDLFTCAILEEYVLDYTSRARHTKLFLRSDELLILVLFLVKRAMYNSHMGGFADLHIPHSRETGGWDGILDLFGDQRDTAAYELQDPLRLADADSVEVLMKTLSESGVECTGNEINKVSNPQHLELRQCYEDLLEEVGWVVEAKQLVPRALDIPVTAAMLLQGFYPAFERVSLHEEPDQDQSKGFGADHFLRDLFGDDPGPELKGEAICFATENSGGGGSDETKLVTQMNPFWGEFFDVAHTGGSAVGSLANAKGCDMKRSDPGNSILPGNTILVFSTLCASTASGVEVCEHHPNYLRQLRDLLPPECEGLDGARVHRDVLGAVEGTPLCERRPRPRDTECGIAHGLLHGRRGAAVSDLDTVETVDVENTQSGLWNRSNSLFRADETDALLSEDATALQLKETDIGGNRLVFRVSAGGVLRLESASMMSDPGVKPVPGVREWLTHVEDNFAEQQRLYEFVSVVTENAASSWRCPLHWMQTFFSDDGFDQARAPVPARNAARFEHITGVDNRFAHPTMRSSTKIEGLHAARFMNDGLACVGRGAECHGKTHLTASVKALLEDQREWRSVDYVGRDSCDRVLDWPALTVDARA